MSLRPMSTVVSKEAAVTLLKQLLECVQECQRRFGGKTELATEFDSCVVALCSALEAVFLYGLRTKLQDNPRNSTLKQVSDIVANTLHLGSENPSFWPFIGKHLTKHELERYAVLKQIWTDTGRSRAWIRATLNERSLERYFHILLSNSLLLKSFYEDYAILRDEEKSSMLPNMAAGIGSILFAINIDNPELNSGVPIKLETLKFKAEPIIEVPVLEIKERHKNKKKKKVARQLILFDGDDNSILSTSAPSSGSSISVDTYSPSDYLVSEEPLRNVLKDGNGKTTKADEMPPSDKRESSSLTKISVESSGLHEILINDIPKTLTPMSISNVGELTPVSVEINENCESSNIVDDNFECPSDISEILDTVEAKNREELKKKQQRIDSLLKENEMLAEQVKKYVEAIQLLQRNDTDLEISSEGLPFNKQPDYKKEAKLFEKKLVQVAEMHAELMDFNTALQQSLRQKDLHIEQMEVELERLREDRSNDKTHPTASGNVHIWIPSAFLTGTGSNAYHVYQIFLRIGNDEWNIYRRYAQFYALHSDLKKLDPIVSTFDFPPKKSLGKKDSALVEDRRIRLQRYLRKIFAYWPELRHCNCRILLEQHLTFFKDKKETAQKEKNIFYPRRSNNTVDKHYEGL